MNPLEMPLPQDAIESISATMAHLYKIVPIEASAKQLTVASVRPLEPVVQNELYTLLGREIRSITVSDAVFETALSHYYPESEVKFDLPLVVDIFPSCEDKDAIQVRALAREILLLWMQDDVTEARLVSSQDDTMLEIARGDTVERIEQFAGAELGRQLIDRFKVMANLGILEARRQIGQVDLTICGTPVLVEFRCAANALVLRRVSSQPSDTEITG